MSYATWLTEFSTPTQATPAPVTTPAPVKSKAQERKEHIETLIAQAQGANDYIKTSVFCKWIYHTDSLDFVCKAAECYWFLDVIVSHLPKLAKRGERFQVWQMTVKSNREARVWCEDGNGNKLAAQIIPWTDFPLSDFKVFCQYGSIDGENPAYIITLPGDY